MFDTLLSRELEPEYEDNLLVQLGLGQWQKKKSLYQKYYK
jgi:hypothetical protein